MEIISLEKNNRGNLSCSPLVRFHQGFLFVTSCIDIFVENRVELV